MRLTERVNAQIQMARRWEVSGQPPEASWRLDAALAVAIGGATETTIRVLPIPLVLATIVLIDHETGALEAILDGRYITEARTAAVSAVSARHLARGDAVPAGEVWMHLGARVGYGRRQRANPAGLCAALIVLHHDLTAKAGTLISHAP